MNKVISLVLSLVMLLSITAGLNLDVFAEGKINTVTLTLEQPPYAGANAEFISENANPNLQYTVDKSVYINGVKWTDETASQDLAQGDTFIYGHSYVLRVRVKAKNGYKFETENITCTIGGSVAGTSRVEGEPGEIIMMEDAFDVTMTFTCNQTATKINSYSISGYTEPITGSSPVWNAVNGTANCSIDTSKGVNGFTWEEYYDYGNRWIEITDSNYKFREAVEYRLTVHLKADRGCSFNFDSQDIDFGIFSNVWHDSNIYQASDRHAALRCRFYCNSLISSINVRGDRLNVKPGNSPSYSFYASVNYDDPYYILDQDNNEITTNGVYYYDETAQEYMLTFDQATNRHTDFILNHQYTMYIRIYKKNFNIFNDYDKIDARFNGSKASVVDRIPGEAPIKDTQRELFVKYNLGVCKYDLNDSEITYGISKPLQRTYSGRTLSIPMALYDKNGKLLYQDIDYKVTYKNNLKVGTAYFTITGINDYRGTWNDIKFTIVAKKITPKVTISGANFTYDGKNKRPTVKVYDGNTLLKNGTDYTVKYSKSESKAVGEYYVQVTLKGNYSGAKRVAYTIKPKKTSFRKNQCYTTKTTMTLGCKQISTQATGYQFQWSKNARFEKNTSTRTTKSTGATGITISGLKKNTKYYCRVRTYKNVKGTNGKTKKIYSDWSGVKEMKTKKK
ncbi:MAG: hypothetical protein IJ927_02130 [Eubacterium sp.]|nr:hypothetical protein [Eubacterium sp.]